MKLISYYQYAHRSPLTARKSGDFAIARGCYFCVNFTLPKTDAHVFAPQTLVLTDFSPPPQLWWYGTTHLIKTQIHRISLIGGHSNPCGVTQTVEIYICTDVLPTEPILRSTMKCYLRLPTSRASVLSSFSLSLPFY